MSAITTHVLDTSIGKPAAGIAVVLERVSDGGAAVAVGRGVTDADGRQRTLTQGGAPSHDDALTHGDALTPGDYTLRFETGAYFAARGIQTFYPHVVISFTVSSGTEHYHVPLLLSPFGYSTYRGS